MPSLYESTAAVGDVASSNFTTLYNASNLTVPNAGAGSVSGNLNVAGNLTVQGTSLLVGAVTLGSTLSLPNYTFPSTDGSTDQVLTTDGSGNLYFTSVSALGASYTIQADTATGGSNLTLVSSGGVLDSVKFANGSNITISRTDANTITIDANAGTDTTYTINAGSTTGGANFNLVGSDATTDTIKFAAGANVSVVQTDANTITVSGLVGPLPSGNQGNILYNDGSNWTASSAIEFANASYRLAFINNIASGTSVTAAEFLKKQSSLDDGDASAIGFGQIVGSTKTFTHRLLSSYDSTGADNNFRIQADATGTFTGSEYAQLYLDNEQLAIFGTELKFLRSHTGAPTQNASITVERGSSTDATLIWSEADDRWSFSNGLNVDGNLRITGLNSYINATSIASNSNLYLKGDGTTPLTDKYIQWDETQQRFFINEDTRIDGGLILKGDYIVLNGDNTAGLNSVIRSNGAGDGIIRWNYAGQFWEFTNNAGTNYYPFVINIDDLNDVVITSVTKGDMLYYDGTDWVNDNKVQSDTSAQRAIFQYNNDTAGVTNAVFARKNYTTPAAFTTGDGTGLGIQVSNDNGAPTTYASYAATYSATNPVMQLRTSTDNFVANNVIVAAIDNSTANFNGTNIVLNANGTGSAAVDATITVERGTTGTDATLGWVESAGAWISSGNFVANGYIGTNDNNFYFNNDDGAAADAFINVKRGASADVNIKWNETTDRWQTTVDGSTYLNIPNQNLDTTDSVEFSAVVIDGETTINTQSTTTTSTATVSISATNRTTQKVVITITDNVTGEMHVLEALAFQKGTTAYLTTYSEMYTAAALATFAAVVSSGNIVITATPASANSTTFKVVRTSLD